jgi:gamma-glutamyltranspeptidase / glutathione hydrolase
VRAAVTASSQAAADAGVAAISAGGNAADAAVTAALASCVADPCNTGIGGYGGYMIVQRPGEDAVCVQFPLCAPSHMTPEQLAREYPEAGPACSAVPNVIGGLSRALSEFGRHSWAQVSEPAIKLAQDGVLANGSVLRAFEQHRHRAFIAECFEFSEAGSKNERRLFFRQPSLARTLQRLAEQGPDWFYSGPVGELANRAWRDAGVNMASGDWVEQSTTVEVVASAQCRIGPLKVYSTPLGISGSACVFAFLTAAHLLASRRDLEELASLAELAKCMAAIWHYRFGVPGGNDFTRTSIESWINGALSHQAPSDSLGSSSGHTAHLNAVDPEGMMAAVTLTHGPVWFGGRWVLPGTGIIMNGGMHNFAHPNVVKRNSRFFGISNMAPTIAIDERDVRIAIGCPGARRIPTNIALTLARHAFVGCDLQEAVSRGRLHAENERCASFEATRLDPRLRSELQSQFEDVVTESADDYFGPLTAVRHNINGSVQSAVDDRVTPGYASGLP